MADKDRYQLCSTSLQVVLSGCEACPCSFVMAMVLGLVLRRPEI